MYILAGHHTADNMQTCLQIHELEWHVKEFQVGFGPMRKTILHDIGTSASVDERRRVCCAHTCPKPHTNMHLRVSCGSAGKTKSGELTAIMGPSGV